MSLQEAGAQAVAGAMMATLPGIDANDPRKTLACFRFYSVVLSSVGTLQVIRQDLLWLLLTLHPKICVMNGEIWALRCSSSGCTEMELTDVLAQTAYTSADQRWYQKYIFTVAL